MKKSLFDLFSGAGGFALGFERSGFESVIGVDNDRAAIRSYAANHKKALALNEDISKLSSRVLERLGGTPDVIIGSPPCEPYTAANPKREINPLDRLYKDPIGRLVLHFIRIVGDLKPKVFVMENVKGLIEGELKRAIANEFKRVGYEKVYFNVLRAEDYCVPSHRVRVFVSNVPIKPKPICKRPVTVEEALKDLPQPNREWPPNHEPPSLSTKQLKRIAKIKWGGALIHYRGSGGRLYPNMVRLHPKKLAPTVLGSSRFIHPYENRILTVREQARLMSYPDNFIFLGGRDSQYNQVGESVPPLLAEVIANVVREHL
ncbi:modification methylase [Ignicoccus islandicus DSM 13165]|uniref:DNA (cytosine-5-)-methyltransferase n=1 Tax=Ignicoccus islandicus DSM 13165 TaxID=940295 RepID=A0A0U3F694_9CREN|nr:DNA cytosine methyltransferase [Ignicoccus islandicus]ALU11592.1 modification methylase [Ignicoccus islandicus DSM 13165]